jgi:hypothetical protein
MLFKEFVVVYRKNKRKPLAQNAELVDFKAGLCIDTNGL